MASEVDICNMALNAMGHEAIQSLLDDSDAARACNAAYALCRDDVLAAHPWNFATKRVQFALLADDLSTVTSDFTHAFQVPTDTLRVLWIEPRNWQYVVEAGGKILTNAGAPLFGGVITRITDSGSFPPFFVMVLVYRLKAELANALTARRGNAQDFYAAYQQKLQEAKSTDGLEGSPTVEDVSPIADARLIGSNVGLWYDGFYAR
jgi:hypothetical protein